MVVGASWLPSFKMMADVVTCTRDLQGLSLRDSFVLEGKAQGIN